MEFRLFSEVKFKNLTIKITHKNEEQNTTHNLY